MHLSVDIIIIVEFMTVEEGSESEDHSFLRFVIVSTLTVVGLALFVLSPVIFYVGILSLASRSEPFNYITYAVFWSFLIVIVVLTTTIDWVRKRKKTE